MAKSEAMATLGPFSALPLRPTLVRGPHWHAAPNAREWSAASPCLPWSVYPLPKHESAVGELVVAVRERIKDFLDSHRCVPGYQVLADHMSLVPRQKRASIAQHAGLEALDINLEHGRPSEVRKLSVERGDWNGGPVAEAG